MQADKLTTSAADSPQPSRAQAMQAVGAIDRPPKKRPLSSPVDVTDFHVDQPAVLVTSAVDEWTQPAHLRHGGLLFKRPLHGRYDDLRAAIDDASYRWGDGARSSGLSITIENGTEQELAARSRVAATALLKWAALPPDLSDQVHSDACTIATTVGCLLPAAPVLNIKLEVVGEGPCSRWHQDNYVARAIVSYTGDAATNYTADANVDFWELVNCGNNACIIKDVSKVEAVDVGDILLMKGKLFPHGARGLVHKAPEKKYHDDGFVINRLILKVDVGPW